MKDYYPRIEGLKQHLKDLKTELFKLSRAYLSTRVASHFVIAT